MKIGEACTCRGTGDGETMAGVALTVTCIDDADLRSIGTNPKDRRSSNSLGYMLEATS